MMTTINVTGKSVELINKEILKILGLTEKVRRREFRAIFIGPPGVGKGTQCEKLKEMFGVMHLSSGNLIKQEMRNGTELGNKMKSYVDAGQLVPDELVQEVINNNIPKEGSWVLDGFPRTLAQGKWFHRQGFILTHVVELVGDENEIKERLAGRLYDPVTKKSYHKVTNPAPAEIEARCVQREDDKPEVLDKRFSEFKAEVNELEKYYAAMVKVINVGGKAMQEVFNEICDKLYME